MADHKLTPMEVEADETVETPVESKRVVTKTPTSQPASVETSWSKREQSSSSVPVETSGSKQSAEASQDDKPASPRGSRSKSAKARKALLREGEENRVQQILYPTPESLADFKRKTGKEFSAKRLLDSSYFAERWRVFAKDPKPTGEARNVLRGIATETFKRPSRRAPPATSEETIGNLTNSKRTRAEITVSTISSTPLGKAPKIPKLKAREPQASTSKVVAPPEPSTIADPNTGDVVVDEEVYNTLDFAEEGTYASAAAGKKSKSKWAESDLALFIHLSEDERKLMPRVTWRMFSEQFQEKILQLDETDQPSPFIDFSGWSKGTGLIVAADEDSKVLVRDLISTMEVQTHKLRAWERGERGAFTLLTCHLPETLNPAIFSGGRTLLNIARKNKLTIGENNANIQALSCKNIAEGTNKRLLRFKVTKNVLKEIYMKKGILYAAGVRLEIHLNGKALTNFSSEELGLD